MSATALASYTLYACTWYVARALDWVQPGWGNADEWADRAARAGYKVTSTPTVGSIAVWGGGLPGSGGFGHVAEVTGLVPGGFTVFEGNFTTPNQPDTRTVSGSGLQHLIGFIQPPGGGGNTNQNPIDQIPVLGGLVQAGLVAPGLDTLVGAGQKAAGLPDDVAGGLAALGQSIQNVPTVIGHGLAGAVAAAKDNTVAFAFNQLPAIAVSAVVLLVLFGAGGNDQQ